MNIWIVCSIVLALASIKVVEAKCGCRVPFKVVGCRVDENADRALPEMLINERDRTSVHYNGIDIDWFKWNEYLPAFTCRCAEAAMKKGYEYFGLQFWAECWSGPSPAADESYEKHDVGDKCYGPSYQKCSPEMDNCVGATHHNMVYKIVPFDCPVKFERMGCYRDSTRPLNDYILTDRDTYHPASSGLSIDWVNYDTHLPDFSCRCAQKAAAKGYNTFGVQYYGECWSGADGEVDYYKDGATDTCVNQCFKPCRNNDRFCTGKGYTNFVYRVTTDQCEIEHKAVGCYVENPENRVLDDLIINDINPDSSKFMGLVFSSFENSGKYLESLICRCARIVKEKGYNTFGIYDGGECWSGANAHSNYETLGESQECYASETIPCNSSSTCSGGDVSNYVYELVLD